MTWQAVWSHGHAHIGPAAQRDRPLRNLSMWLELICPKLPAPSMGRGPRRSVPLRLWRGAATEDGRAISLYLMPDGAVRLVHGDIDLCTDPGMLQPGETMGIRYVTCMSGRSDIFEVTNYDQDKIAILRSGLPHMATLSEALPAVRGYLDVTHVAAIASSLVTSANLPGVESNALVQTDQGPRPVDALQMGDLLLDTTGQAHALRWIDRGVRLCLGRTAPVRLRAPYFGLARDLLVTPSTRLLQTGPVVDYLCGTDAVLAQAADMVNGRAVVRDRAKPIRQFYHLMLDEPACIPVERCPVETAHLGDVLTLGNSQIVPQAAPAEQDLTPSLPLLDRPTARALITANTRAA